LAFAIALVAEPFVEVAMNILAVALVAEPFVEEVAMKNMIVVAFVPLASMVVAFAVAVTSVVAQKLIVASAS
jgi:hypothetical protein